MPVDGVDLVYDYYTREFLRKCPNCGEVVKTPKKEIETTLNHIKKSRWDKDGPFPERWGGKRP